MTNNVFAFTEPGHEYPAYVSINRDDSGRLPGYRISVRSAGNGGRDLGEIHVTPETLEHMAIEVMAAISGEPKPDENPLLTFGQALELLKQGTKVARLGWNGKGMFVSFVGGAEQASEFNAPPAWFNPYFTIRNVDRSISTWVPSINDVLAEDWVIVE